MANTENAELKREPQVRCDDLLSGIERYPTATREKILAITLRNLHTTAKRNGAVDCEEIEYYLQTTAADFKHALPLNDQAQQPRMTDE